MLGYSHGCCWVCFFLAYNNGRRWKVLYSCRLLCFVQFGRGFGVGVSGEGPLLGGPTNGLWVTVVSGAAAVGRDGNPGRPPHRGTKQTNGLSGLRRVAQ